MGLDELPEYVEEVLEEKRRHPGYVLLGIEADYRPDTVGQVADLLRAHPFDYVIGSVHFLGDWGFDDPRYADGFEQRDVDEVYRAYFDLMGRAAESGLFTILGHLDLVKKFGHRPTESLQDAVDALARRLATAGVVVELNTAGLRKPVREIYPGPDVLRALCSAGVPITFGSDAHAPAEVGRDLDRAAVLARECGYDRYVALRVDDRGGSATRELRALPPTLPR